MLRKIEAAAMLFRQNRADMLDSAEPCDPADEPDLWPQVRNALAAIAVWGLLGFVAAIAATLD